MMKVILELLKDIFSGLSFQVKAVGISIIGISLILLIVLILFSVKSKVVKPKDKKRK